MSELRDYGDGYRGVHEPSPQNCTIVCVTYGTSFFFVAGEALFFRERGFKPPFRCRPCRLARRAAREREQSS